MNQTNQLKINILDRVINYIDPKAGSERIAWRNSLSNYDAGSLDRENSGWVVVDGTAESINQGQRNNLKIRARDIERNSTIAEGLINALERNVVGTGFKLQAKVKNDQGNEDEPQNQEIEDIFKEWSKPRNCDIQGESSLTELLKMAIRRVQVDGGFLFIKNYTSDGIVPFVLQAREVDDIDSNKYQPGNTNQNKIINGVELNQYNKPIAYWIKTTSLDGFWDGSSKRIPADRVIYLKKKTRPSQVREISLLARALMPIKHINEFIEAISMKERILACLSVFITKVLPTGGFSIGRNNTDKKSGYKQKTLAPGMIAELSPGDSVQTVNPNGQASNAKEFVCTQQRFTAADQGLSYEAATRDMSQVNYSSARQGLLEDIKTYKMWQQFLIEHFLDEIYPELIISAVLSRKLIIPDFWSNKKNYLRHVWNTPGWGWIDPMKEITANQRALESNQTTLAKICAEHGDDWRDVLIQRAEEKKLEAKLFGGNTGNEQ
jgi:lambda family phage portal protein